MRFTDAASEYWYAGNAWYNQDTGTSTVPTNGPLTARAFEFTKMVWKKTLKVGFGVKDKWVIAWYCDSQPKSNSPGPEFVRNVGAKCINADGVNTCYNLMATTQHNERRAAHESPLLTWDAPIAKAVQQTLDGLSKDNDVRTMGVSAGLQFACSQNIYEEKDPTKAASLLITEAATAAWYAGNKDYDFAAGAAKQTPTLVTPSGASAAIINEYTLKNNKITTDN